MKTYFMKKKTVHYKTVPNQQKEQQIPFLRYSGLLNGLLRSSKTPLQIGNRQNILATKIPPLKQISYNKISPPEKLPTISNSPLSGCPSSLKKIDNTSLIALNITTRCWLVPFRHKKIKILRLEAGLQEINRQFDKDNDFSHDNLFCTKKKSFFKQGCNYLECMVKVTKIAAGMIGTTANLKCNYWVSIQDLLYGAMLPSGNDAAYSLAEYIGYCFFQIHHKNIPLLSFKALKKIDLSGENTAIYVQQFIHCMNEKAIKLNLVNTSFSNPHGLQNALNTSSPKDIIKLCVAAFKYQVFRKIVSTISYKYELFEDSDFSKGYVRQWFNTNILLDKGRQGLKTGLTNAAGSCLASYREGVYIVVLNCINSSARFEDTQQIYKWYKDNFSPRKESQSLLQITSYNPREIQSMKIFTQKTEDSIS